MDIRNWPMNRIMQLPDCAFGRKFLVSCWVTMTSLQTKWDISEIALPERFVIWQFVLWPCGVTGLGSTIRLAMGDQLPTTTAMMDLLEPLIPGLGMQGGEPRSLYPYYQTSDLRLDLRTPVHASGRRLVMEGTAAEGKLNYTFVGIVVSSVPKDVPEWLISAPANALL